MQYLRTLSLFISIYDPVQKIFICFMKEVWRNHRLTWQSNFLSPKDRILGGHHKKKVIIWDFEIEEFRSV